MQLPDRFTYKNLRITTVQLFDEYMKNTRRWQEVGNETFAEFIRSHGTPEQQHATQGNTGASEYLLYHSWLPEMMTLDKSRATVVSNLISGISAGMSNEDLDYCNKSLGERGFLDDGPVDIDNLVSRSLNEIIAIQNPYELKEFLKVVAGKSPKIIVEIGSARGGMLYNFCQLADPRALIISIDLPGAPNCGGQTNTERSFFNSFRQAGQTMRFIPDNSHNHTTRELLRNILDGRQVDLMFVDGDHSYGGVKIDHEMYAEFVAPGGLLAFHDICLLPEHWGGGSEVGVYWQEIAPKYPVREIIDPNGVCRPDAAPGVAQAWGIGIIEVQ